MLIGISGRLHSGKDTSALTLVKALSFKRVGAADALKDLLAAMLPEFIERASLDDQALKDAPLFEPLNGSNLFTRRDLMQRLGNGARQTFGEDFWIDRVVHDPAPLVVLSDLRYWNEVHSVRRAGGFVVRVNRTDRKHIHSYMPGVGMCAELCVYVFMAEKKGMRICGLPEQSHPTHWNGHDHPSEVELPDESSFYHSVVTTPSAEETAECVLEFARRKIEVHASLQGTAQDRIFAALPRSTSIDDNADFGDTD